MSEAMTFSRTDLTRKTRQILELVRRGRPAVIRSYGKDQAILLDAMDYRLLRGLAGLASDPEESEIRRLLRSYLDEEISLSRTAEALGVSRFELMERFDRLGAPLRNGPSDLGEAKKEVNAARTWE